MPEDGVGNSQDAFDLGNLGLVQIELFDDVMPFPLVFDRVGQSPLSPWGDLFHLASVGLNQLADLFDLLLDCLVIKLRLDDVHQFVRRQSTTSFPLEICSAYGPRGSN